METPAAHGAEHGLHPLRLILVLLSGSRGSAISLVVILLAFWFAKPLRPWAWLGAGLVGCTFLAAPILLASLNNRANENWGTELGGRDQLWEASLQAFDEHPIIGIGVGNGPDRVIVYVNQITDDYRNRTRIVSHNPLLEVLLDTGVIGLGIYLAICAAAVWQFARGRRKTRLGPYFTELYFPLVTGLTVAYTLSWIKSGGMENHPSFFAVVTLLLLPSYFVEEPARASQTEGRALEHVPEKCEAVFGQEHA